MHFSAFTEVKGKHGFQRSKLEQSYLSKVNKMYQGRKGKRDSGKSAKDLDP